VAAWLAVVPMTTTAAIVVVVVLLLVPAPEPRWPGYVRRHGGQGFGL
jgi:hypothetical protein